MKLSHVSLGGLLATVATAQVLTAFPPCATSCLSSAVLEYCTAVELPCACSNSDAIGSAVLPCAVTACPNPADLTSLQSAASSACAALTSTAPARVMARVTGRAYSG